MQQSDDHTRIIKLAIKILTRDSGCAEIVRSTLEAIAYQTGDLLQGMEADNGIRLERLRVDGGMANNDWLMEFLAGRLTLQVDRPVITVTIALGAAYLAGLQLGLFKNLEEIEERWRLQQSFTPQIAAPQRDELRRGWSRAVERVLLA